MAGSPTCGPQGVQSSSIMDLHACTRQQHGSVSVVTDGESGW